MATTKNGIYYQDDGTKSADILADMKKLAESVDIIVEENKDEQEIAKQDISNIKEEQTEQNIKLQEIEDNQIHIETEKSSNINVQDSSNQRARIDVYGSSSQETRQGYNLLNVESNFTVSIFKEIPINLKKGTYTVKFENAVADKNNNVSMFSFRNTADVIIRNIDTSTIKKFNVELSEDVTNIRIYASTDYNASLECTKVFDNLMIYEGLEDKKYEEYGASPSSNYKSEIENVGDNINLFDKDNVNILDTPLDSNGLGTNVKDTYKTIWIPCKANTTYTISKKYDETKNRFNAGYSNVEPAYNLKEISGYINSPNSKTITIVTGNEAKYLIAYIWISGGSTTYQEMIDSIKIEKGTIATKHSLFNCGNVDITICNKNFFNSIRWKKFNGSGGYPIILSDDDNSVEILEQTTNSIKYKQNANYRGIISDYIKVKKNQIFELQCEHANINRIFITQYDSSKTRVKELTNNTILENVKFTIESDGYIAIGFSYASSTTQTNIIEIKNITLELNRVTGDFEENKEQTITFPLQENQKLYEGSYLSDDGIHHKRKQIELNGTENWIADNQASPDTCRGWKILVEDYIGYEGNFRPFGGILCSHFVERQTYNNEVDGVRGGWGKWIFIKMKVEDLGSTDTTGFKSYLAEQKANGTPAIVEYELAEEIIEPYNEEQKEVYNKLQNILAYKTVTNIFTDKAKLVFNYVADTKTYIDNKYNSLAQQILNLAGGN